MSRKLCPKCGKVFIRKYKYPTAPYGTMYVHRETVLSPILGIPHVSIDEYCYLPANEEAR